MSIEINQTLHGYQNGHQLLASSVELSLVEKKLLLFQSDLSGSNIDEGFDNYLTGYPISEVGLYAFAKTWYAKEMKRPGCVWTHTLLIKFSDLGKIPDFNLLEHLFHRPALNDYQIFSSKIDISAEKMIAEASTEDIKLNEPVKGMLEALYIETDKAAIVPAKNAEEYKKDVLDIWSDQWPRLRRSFTFCTGALSNRMLEDKNYDFQIVPQKNLSIIERKAKNIFISHHSSDQVNDLIKILNKFSKNERRKFLWTYGADIEGERKNYVPLLKVFETINKPNADLKEIAARIEEFFPDKTQARLLKNKLFGKESILLQTFSEFQLMQFLLHDNLTFIDPLELHLEERLLKMLNSREISINTFLDVWENAIEDRISLQFIENFEIDRDELLYSITKNPELVDLFLHKMDLVSDAPETWKLNINSQRKILNHLLHNSDITRSKYVNAILISKSEIVLDLYSELGNEIIIDSLDWLNASNDRVLNYEWSKEIADAENVLKRWISNHGKPSISIYNLIFNYFNFGQIRKLNFSADDLLDIYSKLNVIKQDQVFSTIVIFSLGLDEKLRNGKIVIKETFQATYDLASASKIDAKYWAIIPKEEFYDTDNDDDAYDPFFTFSFFKTTKKKKGVPAWDYCELLVRTVTNRCISQSWDKRLFLKTFKSSQSFMKSINYCLTFKSGIRFLSQLIEEVSVRRDIATDQQKKILSSVDFE